MTSSDAVAVHPRSGTPTPEPLSELFAPRGSTAGASDPDFPRFHLAPPRGRLNDPNGLCIDDGVAHAFYQWGPGFPARREIGWGHAASTDLIHWDHRPAAVVPTHSYDRSGCYSGSAAITPGGYSFLYTGNVKTAAGGREAHQCLLTSADLTSFDVAPDNPVIPHSARPEAFTEHFRDPMVFVHAGDSGATRYRMCLGAQRRHTLSGAVALYSATSVHGPWRYDGELTFTGVNASDLSDFGHMWECPNLVRVHDEATHTERDVLIFCPQGLVSGAANPYGRDDSCGYIVGTLDGTTFHAETAFRQLDHGFEFYAPQVFAQRGGDSGRPLLMGWVGNPSEDDLPSLSAHGWVHTLSIPRRLGLRDGVLLQSAGFERSAFGVTHQLPVSGTTLADGTASIDIPLGNPSFLFEITADVTDAVLELRLSSGPHSVGIDVDATGISVDRSRTRYPRHGSRRVLAPASTPTRRLLIAHDRSVTEIFLDDGETVFSLRSFLGAEPPTISLRARRGDLTLGATAVTLLR